MCAVRGFLLGGICTTLISMHTCIALSKLVSRRWVRNLCDYISIYAHQHRSQPSPPSIPGLALGSSPVPFPPPKEERTLATSIALNANQLGVGLAFIVGALYVQSPSQIATYFGLLSFFSVIAFVGTALHLDDAPPTPPSGSSRIIKGTLEISVKDLLEKASSSLLVRDATCGKYDFGAEKLWGYCGDYENIERDSSALSTSAKSLLRRHISQKDEHVQPSASPRDPSSQSILASPYSIDSSQFGDYEGAEPTLTQTPHHLEIDIRDDQVLLAAKACLSRNGFSQVLVMFTAAGLVINVMSTYLDYLVRGNYHGENDVYNDNAGQTSSAAVYVALIGEIHNEPIDSSR